MRVNPRVPSGPLGVRNRLTRFTGWGDNTRGWNVCAGELMDGEPVFSGLAFVQLEFVELAFDEWVLGELAAGEWPFVKLTLGERISMGFFSFILFTGWMQLASIFICRFVMLKRKEFRVRFSINNIQVP